ncbi:unnamed protein product [Miscanthus lutarioriparius]|uniref:Uncharacterized protein n=1 Tax=Miscanthus lutarioriparius TaxID=422564 RepID=A0A811PP94_9POAL|nr:unnamed protein product [Miscanthus lutarioriparius]
MASLRFSAAGTGDDGSAEQKSGAPGRRHWLHVLFFLLCSLSFLSSRRSGGGLSKQGKNPNRVQTGEAAARGFVGAARARVHGEARANGGDPRRPYPGARGAHPRGRAGRWRGSGVAVAVAARVRRACTSRGEKRKEAQGSGLGWPIELGLAARLAGQRPG